MGALRPDRLGPQPFLRASCLTVFPLLPASKGGAAEGRHPWDRAGSGFRKKLWGWEAGDQGSLGFIPVGGAR